MLSLVFLKTLNFYNETGINECRNSCGSLPGLEDFEVLEDLKMTDAFFVDISYNFRTTKWLWAGVFMLTKPWVFCFRTTKQLSIRLTGTQVTPRHTQFWTMLYFILRKLWRLVDMYVNSGDLDIKLFYSFLADNSDSTFVKYHAT